MAYFSRQPDWEVIGVSRRAPDLMGVTHLPLDLTSPKQCDSLAKAIPGTTHVIYAALYEQPGLISGWQHPEQMSTNLAMLQNLMEPLTREARHLEQVSILQGTKAYGAHIKPMRIPGRELEARVQHENFYWLQEDYLKDLRYKKSWTWTIWRPQITFGHALGAPMNMLAAIGVYGAVLKHLNKPLIFPGGPTSITEATDAALLASAMFWATRAEQAKNEVFNITNGDVFSWKDIWPAIARSLGMEAGDQEPDLLQETMPEYSEIWNQVVREHHLIPHSMEALVGDSFFYADALFATGADRAPPPALVSTVKLRQAGFNDCIDTEVMFNQWFEYLQSISIIPRP